MSASSNSATRWFAPGNKTGIYHVPFCNLPKRCSWREVRDFLKPCLRPDAELYVEVFDKIFCGWIKVRHYHNFQSLIQHLETTPFHGRFMWADGKNADYFIQIRVVLRLASTKTYGNKQLWNQALEGAGAYQSKVAEEFIEDPVKYLDQYQSTSTATYESYGGGYAGGGLGAPMQGGFESGVPGPVAQHGYQTSGYHGGGSIYDMYSGNPVESRAYPTQGYGFDVSTYGQHLAAGFPAQSARQGTQHGAYVDPQAPAYMPSGYGTGDSQADPESHAEGYAEGYIETEMKKIIITQLPRGYNEKTLRDFVRNKAGRWSQSVTHYDYKGHRGVAFVYFNDEQAAAGVAKTLNNKLFIGAKITARQTTEGISSYKGHASSSRHRHSQTTENLDDVEGRGEDKGKGKSRTKGKEKERDREKGKGKGAKEQNRDYAMSNETEAAHSAASEPIVVDGTSETATSKQKGRGGSRDHQALADHTRRP